MLTATHRLRDGRTVSYSELGTTDGFPVIWCHGGLSSRLDAENARAGAEAAGIRLIALDRPGIADSDRVRDHRVADCGDDARELADHLGLDRLAVVGWSAGGPHALACAASLGERVRAVATIGGLAPIRDRADRKELGLKVDRLLVPLCRRAPWLASVLLRRSARRPPERMKDRLVDELSSADGRVLAPLSSARISDPFLRAMVHGPHGLIDDYRAIGTDWGFDPASIVAPVRVWQGERDRAVSTGIAQRLVALLPRAALESVADAGHFLVLEHGTRVFEQLRADAGS